MVLFGICTPERAAEARLRELLLRWAELTCLDLDTVTWRALEELLGDPGADGCAMFFLDAADWGAGQRPMLRRLKDRCPQADLVFLSADSRFAIESYPLHPAGFLQKPVGYGGLVRTLERCLRLWRAGLRWLEAPVSRTTVRVPLCEVRYAEASGRTCVLHCGEGALPLSRGLGWLEPLLSAGPFLRCQKSFIVNLCAVTRCSGGELVMADGAVITIGRGQRKEVQGRYGDYLRLTAAEGV